jgi:hypothetical protein
MGKTHCFTRECLPRHVRWIDRNTGWLLAALVFVGLLYAATK